MTPGTFALWVYLSRTPLLWLTVTLVAYLVADRISADDIERIRDSALNPPLPRAVLRPQ